MAKSPAFTLIELMVVAVIVAILAAVAVPLMSGYQTRAAMTEGEAALGTIRFTLGIMRAETGAFNRNISGAELDSGSSVFDITGLVAGDLDGRYFEDDDYSFVDLEADSYTIQVAGDTEGSAPAGDIVNGITITLDENGHFTRTGL